MAFERCIHERRPLLVVSRVDLHAALGYDPLRDLRFVSYDRFDKSIFDLFLALDVVKKNLDYREMTFLRCQSQRTESLVVDQVDIGAAGQKRAHGL